MMDTPTRTDRDPPENPTIGAVATGSRRPAPQLRLPGQLRRELAHLAELSYPYEACGVLLGLAAGRLVAVERVLHGRNLHLERLRDRYLLDPGDFLAADRAARATGLEIVGIWHSHPDGSPRPSRTDLETAWEGYSYVIVSISAVGTSELGSWRLQDGRFLEEEIVD